MLLDSGNLDCCFMIARQNWPRLSIRFSFDIRCAIDLTLETDNASRRFSILFAIADPSDSWWIRIPRFSETITEPAESINLWFLARNFESEKVWRLKKKKTSKQICGIVISCKDRGKQACFTVYMWEIDGITIQSHFFGYFHSIHSDFGDQILAVDWNW